MKKKSLDDHIRNVRDHLEGRTDNVKDFVAGLRHYTPDDAEHGCVKYFDMLSRVGLGIAFLGSISTTLDYISDSKMDGGGLAVLAVGTFLYILGKTNKWCENRWYRKSMEKRRIQYEKEMEEEPSPSF